MSKATGGISSWGTVRTFLKVGTCSEAIFNVLDRAYEDRSPLEERAVMPLAGGIVQHGYQCGLMWGAALAAGARAYRLFGAGPQAEARALGAAKRLVGSFRARYGDIDCMELTGTDWRKSAKVLKYVIKGGTFKCFSMAGRFAQSAFGEINAALSEEMSKAPSPPVSCTTLLARKMGASDGQAVMAAGLAGGIGLSGDACGALGAAIWIIGMRSIEEGAVKMKLRNPEALDVVEKFIESADYRFECLEIVGRKFETIEDHAAFLRDGGCTKIIETLAAL